MDCKSLSLMQKLINLTTANNLDRTNGILANYLLLHYDQLEQISLNQVVAECYISVSSVRRFCRRLGFENYSDLIASKLGNPEKQKQIATDNLRSGYYDPARLRSEINENLYLCYRSLSPAQLQSLVQQIHDCSALVLIATRPYSFWVREFYNQLVAWGKLTYTAAESKMCRSIYERFGEKTCTILVSPMGILPETYAPQIRELPGYKVLITGKFTQDHPAFSGYASQYQQILLLPFKNSQYEYMEIYGKYTIGFLFDTILGQFLRQIP